MKGISQVSTPKDGHIRFRAVTHIGGKYRHLGVFRDVESAQDAYNEAIEIKAVVGTFKSLERFAGNQYEKRYSLEEIKSILEK